MEIEHSTDGNNFQTIYESFPNNDFSLVQEIFSYHTAPKNLESRYIRVIGMNLNKCPDYHPGAGGPCWVFADEIIIH